PAERDAVGQENAVVSRHFLLQVGEERDGDARDASPIPRRVDPGQVRELAVDRRADDLAADLAELAGAVVEGENLGRADEREVERVEKQYQVLALVVGQGHVLEVTVDHRLAAEVRGGLLYVCGHSNPPVESRNRS